MLEITIKLRGEQAAGKTVTLNNIVGMMKLCPYEFRLEAWTKQPNSPVWTREALLSNADGKQIDDREHVISEEEPR